jgi:hypothetical protein
MLWHDARAMAKPISPARSCDWTLLAIGAALTGGGIYFALVGLATVPTPSKLHGPNWIALAVGVVFAAAGVNVLMRGWLGLPDNEPNLPADTPVVLVALQWFSAVAVIVALASIGTWIAFGSGERHFSIAGPVAGPVGNSIGRAMFGFGAIFTWLMAALMAYAGAKKFFGKKN